METMKRTTIEPGLLHVFRIFILVRLLLIFIGLRLQTLVQVERGRLYLLFLLIEATILLFYLSWSWARIKLGRSYLPLGLIYATAIPIFEQAIAMLLRGAGIIQGNATTGGVWGLVILLLVPLILVSWQYSFKIMIAYVISAALFEWVLIIPIGYRLGIDIATIIGVVIVRSILFLLIGSIIVRLMRDQREHREALAQANIKLTQHASTIAQLATSQERNRLARELHDTLAHTLSSLAVQLEAMDSLIDREPQSLPGMLERALMTTRGGLNEARRAIGALRASPLDDLGLILSLREMAEGAAERSNLTLDLDLPERFDTHPDIEQGLYRIAEQAIANVTQHASASHLELRLTRDDGQVTLSITDDGRGFNPAEVKEAGHFGLRGMQERAEIIGGVLEIISQIGKGTIVSITMEESLDSSINL
jgi:signal transduction histidine kinase